MKTEKTLNDYLDDKGKVTEYPSKKHRDMRIVIYKYLVTKFEKNKIYTQKEVNDIISQWTLFNDPVLVRREMIEAKLLDREVDGSKYWVK